ncbi:acyltransferase family protein [Nocardia sp. XZ_19_385]|uniref:acyltransferase family protein n=1 Tax=Nocardia sp. XZ_19_385 TaxID=2769488 RepID=UPI001E43A0B2|nr:acyltransferase family protein [Nocardia sp. XZ_19_385]
MRVGDGWHEELDGALAKNNDVRGRLRARMLMPRLPRRAEPVRRVANSSVAPEYRHDLDGLRGLAIALVVVFHVWMGRVSGGVDVFLVLSGFFFTGMLVRRSEIKRTLLRTGRRLLPALTVVLVTVLGATAIARPYTQWGDISGQTLASALYYQNWFLAGAELDYLAPDPSVSPLQHLWSMAVQAQFYLVILVVVAVWARRSGQRMLLLAGLIGAGAVSFWYAAEGAAQHQAWTYYDSGARAWELLAGAALAVAAPWIKVPHSARAVLAILGLAMVISCGMLIDGASRFPGPAALFPVAAAVALIVSGMGTAPWVNRLLAALVLVRLGGLAYALYLWHWPVLIFYLAQYGKVTPGLQGGLLVVGVSLVLAVLTERYVETPLRQRGYTEGMRYRRGVGFVTAMAGVGVLVAALGWQAVLKANPAHAPEALDAVQYPGAAVLFAGAVAEPERMRPTVFEAQKDAPRPTSDGCITPNRDVRVCTYGDENAARTIALVGGSHSEHWLPTLEVLAAEHRFRIVTYLKEGCPLTLVDEPSYALAPFPECREWSVEVLDRLAGERPDWVFLTATRPRTDDGDTVPPEYLDIWSALSERALNVLAVRDTPWPRRDGVTYRALDCLAHRGTAYSCGIDRATALTPENPAAQPASAYPNVFPVDLTDAICRPDRCLAAEGNILVYRDEHHISASFARTLAPELGRQIGAITQWW